MSIFRWKEREGKQTISLQNINVISLKSKYSFMKEIPAVEEIRMLRTCPVYVCSCDIIWMDIASDVVINSLFCHPQSE